MESNDKSKDIDIKNGTVYFFDDIIKIEDLDLNDILIDDANARLLLILCVLDSIKQMDLSEFIMELDIQYYLELKNTIAVIAGLDAL